MRSSPSPSVSDASSSNPSVASDPAEHAGKVSKLRSHKGNIPYLPQTKLCHLCPAKFTRTTHLNRHIQTHTRERLHRCNACNAQFTRGDLLSRHKRSCPGSTTTRSRRKACESCAESKVKCDLQQPCSKCKAKGYECVFANRPRPPTSTTASRAISPQTSLPSGHTPSGLVLGYEAEEDVVLTSFGADTFFSSFTDSHERTSASESASSSTALVPSIIAPSFGEKTHLQELFAGDRFDSLFNNIFDSHFQKSPDLPGHHFQFDPVGALTDRLDLTRFAGPTDTSWLYSVERPLSISHMAENPESVGYVPGPEAFLGRIDHIEREDNASQSSDSSTSAEAPDSEFTPAELQMFLAAFFKTFAVHVPMVHTPTIHIGRQPPMLVTAMRACGAMYVQTPAAKRYVEHALDTVRDALVAKFSSQPTDTEYITQLLQAAVMIQTLGVSHRLAEQRARSIVYHGIIAMMLRMSGFYTRLAKWRPGKIDFANPASLRTEWRRWILQETAVRAVWVCQLQDGGNCINFNVLPTTHDHSCIVPLPSEEELWTAPSAEAWAAVLQRPSVYGTVEERLVGTLLPTVYDYLVSGNETLGPRTLILNPFAQTLYLCAVLTKLHGPYLRDRMPSAGAGGDATRWKREELRPHAVDQQRVFILQLLLHYWFQCWKASPTAAAAEGGQTPFMLNPLPFYWLAQVCMIAYQEGLPPFDAEGTYVTSATAKFELLKRWERHIREFLADGEERPATELWETVMMSRLDALQAETGWKPPGDFEHLLGFFAKT